MVGPVLGKVVKAEQRQESSRSEVSPRISVLEPNLLPCLRLVLFVSLLLGLAIENELEKLAQDAFVHVVGRFIRVAQLSLEVHVPFVLKGKSNTVTPDKVVHAKASHSRSYLVIADAVVTQRRSNAAAAEDLEERALLVLKEQGLVDSEGCSVSDFLLRQLADPV